MASTVESKYEVLRRVDEKGVFCMLYLKLKTIVAFLELDRSNKSTVFRGRRPANSRIRGLGTLVSNREDLGGSTVLIYFWTG